MMDNNITIGEGVLSWNRDERLSDRYGSVNLNISMTENGKVSYDKSCEGKYGVLAAFIKESRPSSHTGDSFRKLSPTPVAIGDLIVLGMGTLFFEIKDGVEDVGLIPVDGRTVDWLVPSELYRIHDQTVVLVFKELSRSHT